MYEILRGFGLFCRFTVCFLNQHFTRICWKSHIKKYTIKSSREPSWLEHQSQIRISVVTKGHPRWTESTILLALLEGLFFPRFNSTNILHITAPPPSYLCCFISTSCHSWLGTIHILRHTLRGGRGSTKCDIVWQAETDPKFCDITFQKHY